MEPRSEIDTPPVERAITTSSQPGASPNASSPPTWGYFASHFLLLHHDPMTTPPSNVATGTTDVVEPVSCHFPPAASSALSARKPSQPERLSTTRTTRRSPLPHRRETETVLRRSVGNILTPRRRSSPVDCCPAALVPGKPGVTAALPNRGIRIVHY